MLGKHMVYPLGLEGAADLLFPSPTLALTGAVGITTFPVPLVSLVLSSLPQIFAYGVNHPQHGNPASQHQ